MSNQLLVKQHMPAPVSGKTWLFFWIISSIILLTTVGAALNIAASTISLFNIFTILGLTAFAFIRNYKRQTVTFLKINESNIEYYCVEEKQMVQIPSEEIINVTTRFCELNIHTRDKVHTLNIKMIRHEQQRWEIKQMIREIVASHKLSAAS